MKRNGKGWLITATFLVFLFLSVACEVETDELESRGPDDVDAKSICDQFVKPRLRNPLSADFKGFAGMGGAAEKLPGLHLSGRLPAT